MPSSVMFLRLFMCVYSRRIILQELVSVLKKLVVAVISHSFDIYIYIFIYVCVCVRISILCIGTTNLLLFNTGL